MRAPALLLIATALSQPALADDDIFDLGVIEVNAKAEQELLSDKETLTAEDIARNNRNDVASALNLLPGVSVQNLGARNERLIYLRGFNSRQVPLFMDGIPVYVPYDGNVDLNRFTTFDIIQRQYQTWHHPQRDRRIRADLQPPKRAQGHAALRRH